MKSNIKNSQIFDPADENAFSEILKYDSKAFTPPESAKTEVFKELNLNHNAIYYQAGKAPYHPFIKVIKKVAVPIAAGLLIFLGTYLVMNMNYGVVKNDNSIDNINNNNSINNSKIFSIVNKNTEKYPIASSIKAEKANKQFSLNENAQYIENNAKMNENAIGTNYITEEIIENNITANLISTKDDFYQLSNNTGIRNWSGAEFNQLINYNTSNDYQRPYPFIFNTHSSNKKYSFQLVFKGLLGTTFSEMNNFKDGYFNSFMAGGYTTMESIGNFQIGVIFGKEQFAKKYFNKEERNIIEYTNNQSTFWMALAGKYSFPEVNLSVLNIRPFAEIAIGAGEIGPMARASAGIQQQIIGNLAANVSVDFATMFYNNRYNWYASKKLGVSAGLMYNL